MRDAFVKRLLELARLDSRLFLVTGDLGFGVLDTFEKELPGQYLNVGVAEQNMAAVATGLALEGLIPFTYSIGNFPTLRCLEQLRNDAFYHDANVKVVCIGGGFTYGQLGMSHHATEDLSIMRALPNVTVVVPANDLETVAAVDALVARPGPAYLRIERAADARLDPGAAVPFELGKARVLRAGNDAAILATGGVVSEALMAAEQLAQRGLSVRVLSMHTLKPLDTAAIVAAARETRALVTVEEHTIIGGLGGAVAETCMDAGVLPRRFTRLGLKDQFSTIVGDQQYLRAAYGMDAATIVGTLGKLLSVDSGERKNVPASA
jgi:transketolase